MQEESEVGVEGVSIQPKIMAAAMPPCTSFELASGVDDAASFRRQPTAYHANEGRKLGAQL